MSSTNNVIKLLSGERQFSAGEVISLHNCDKEPIHIPGSIQPHGFLIGFSDERKVLYVSTNIDEITAKPAEIHLGCFLDETIGKAAAAVVENKLPSLSNKKYFKLDIPQPNGAVATFGALLHRSNAVYILELEPALEKSKEEAIDIEWVNESMQQMQEAATPLALATIIAREVKELTGFGRVMVYQFQNDESGEVIAEEKQEDMPPFLGLRYPATDIPRQARRLYLLNPIRIIPDVAYAPVAITTATASAAGTGGGGEGIPLDLSYAGLRSVSPIHVQYLKNMGVGASMSVSIVKNNRLWGLIACHHPTPHYLSYPYRQLCELLARSFAMVLGEKEEALHRKYKQQLQEVKKTLFQRISTAENFTDGLHGDSPTAKDLVRCSGCVISIAEGYIPLGETPAREEVMALLDWLQKENDEEVFATHRLPKIYSPAEKFSATGSGVLAITISRVQKEYILWFRPELLQSISWAGKQEKEIGPEGGEQLSPRNSFKEWSEVVRHNAEPWLKIELEAAKDLRGLIVDMVLRMSGQLKLKADILTRLNKEMESSKSEMDSFAYMASHDLKEPLRGIQTYADFVMEDYGDQLGEEGQERLKTIVRLSHHSQDLVDSLLQFSRLGRMELQLEEVALEQLLNRVIDVFRPRLKQEHITIDIEEGKWPVIQVDSLRISEVFINLISNAIKYNNKEEKHVKVGFRLTESGEEAPSGYVFFVQDNGIGIQERHYKNIFTVFRRLNSRTAYGGGTGAGLTITKRIVERHGGRIWLNSQEGEGSIFFFTL